MKRRPAPLERKTHPMNLQAVIFDFDGVCIDTERARYISYSRICSEYGFDLPLDEWVKNIGKAQWVSHPFDLLEKATGRKLDRGELEARHRMVEVEIADGMPLQAGLLDRLIEAKSLGIALGMASSSSRQWVEGHLYRRGLLDRFDVVVCREDTLLHKPDPAPYLTVLEKLGVQASNSIAVEDSTAGIASAKAAGLYCVAVPCSMTGAMDFSQADMLIGSLEEVSWKDFCRSECGKKSKTASG